MINLKDVKRFIKAVMEITSALVDAVGIMISIRGKEL